VIWAAFVSPPQGELAPPYRVESLGFLYLDKARTMNTRLQTDRLMVSAMALAVFFVGVLFADVANAATYYVSPSGNDSNPGTQTQPFRTIARGLTVTRAGDTLYIRGGTYSESINSGRQTIPTGTSWTNAPRIAAHPSETVVLSGSYGNGINLAASYVQYVIFDGLIVDGGGVSIQNGAHHIRFQNGEVRNAMGQGVQGGYGGTTTTNLELVNMKIHHNGSPVEGPSYGGRFDHGVYVAIQGLLIDGCDIYENTGYGIQIYDSSGGNSSGTVIRNTRVHDNHGDGGVILSYGSDIQFYNNVVYNNQTGVGVNYGASNVQIYNNTIYNHPNGMGIEVGTGASGTNARNNILYRNGQALANYSGSTTASSNLTTDPRFADATNGNFALQSSSPAIDAGVTISIVTTDFLGAPRPSGAAYDIGAIEYGSTGSMPSAPQNLRLLQ
jgi:hypothetical protein